MSDEQGRVELRDCRVVADDTVGWSGGYRVMRGDEVIGRIERHFPTWERRSPGKRYVNARGTCKRAEYRVGGFQGVTFRTLREAVQSFAKANP